MQLFEALVPHEADPDPQHEAVAEDDLVELAGEGGEEAAEAEHEPAHHRRDPRGLPLADGDGEGRDQERHAH